MKRKNNAVSSIEISISILIGLFFFKKGNFLSAFKAFATCFIMIAILSLIISYILYMKHKKKLLRSGIDLVDKMTGEEFEKFLLVHFEKLNYHVKLTPVTSDYGADLIIKKDNIKTVVQAKRWSQKVGIEAIQQILGAKQYYNADKCIVITNNYFTPNAINLASSSSVELWDRNQLIKNMNIGNGNEIATAVTKDSKIICPRCGTKMKLVKGKYGYFYGCSNYPKCKYTKTFNS